MIQQPANPALFPIPNGCQILQVLLYIYAYVSKYIHTLYIYCW